MIKGIFKTSPKVTVEYFSDGALALRTPDLNIFELNSTASEIIKQTDGVHSVQQVADIIEMIFEITPSKAIQDVNDMLDYFIQNRLIERITQE